MLTHGKAFAPAIKAWDSPRSPLPLPEREPMAGWCKVWECLVAKSDLKDVVQAAGSHLSPLPTASYAPHTQTMQSTRVGECVGMRAWKGGASGGAGAMHLAGTLSQADLADLGWCVCVCVCVGCLHLRHGNTSRV